MPDSVRMPALQPWEGSVVEAPFLWTSGGQFYLFYSANSYANGTHWRTVPVQLQPLVSWAPAQGG